MKIKCPWCEQEYDIDATMIGNNAQCQKCGKEFFIDENDVYDKESVHMTQNIQKPIGSSTQSEKETSKVVPIDHSSYIEETKTKLMPLTCEMCGSTDILKQDGMFICQSCGTKYSVEEAKKMMVSGTINVAGTVKVDNSAFVEKYLANARRALGKDDWEEVEKYYNLVEQNTTNNMEAVFFSSFGKTMLSLTDNNFIQREQKFHVLIKSISVINDYYELSNEDKETVLRRISSAIEKMFNTPFVCSNGSVESANNRDELATDLLAARGSNSWNIELMNSVRSAFLIELKQIQALHKEETFIQELIDKNSSQVSTGACYIATAIYGSYDCPQVWTLRRYRDSRLASSFLGRCFIHTYYAISPTLIQWFGENDLIVNNWRKILDRMVKNLNREGVSNLPYNDKRW